MRILVVNDDGINAKGIRTLAAMLAKNHDVTVVAPTLNQSATSHSVTLNRPLRVTKITPKGLDGINCYMIDGSPVDCTKIGMSQVIEGDVDLVVSGINHGHNLGSDMLYSGTVAAALDAVLMGFKALAVSVDSYAPEHFDSVAKVACGLIDGGLLDDQPKGTLYNLNVPDLPFEDIKGVRATRQGKTVYEDAIEVRVDPRGNKYFWIAGKLQENKDIDDTDVSQVKQGYASVTPVKYDLTAHDQMEKLSCKIEKIKLHFV